MLVFVWSGLFVSERLVLSVTERERKCDLPEMETWTDRECDRWMGREGERGGRGGE